MRYDRDIRWMRIGTLAMIAIDLLLAGGTLYRHQWIFAFAAVVWALNCRIALVNLKLHQTMRDRDREITAAIFRELQDLER